MIQRIYIPSLGICNEKTPSTWKSDFDFIVIWPVTMDLSHITQDTPAMMPPHGMTSNFETPHSTSGGIYATLILSIVISTVFVWTRLYTRYFVIKLYGWEDCTLSPSFLCDHAWTELFEDTSLVAWVRLPILSQPSCSLLQLKRFIL